MAIEKVLSDELPAGQLDGYDLGYFGDKTGTLEPLQNPFGPKVSPVSAV